MDEVGEAPKEAMQSNEGKSKDMILDQARNNMERKRQTPLVVDGLEPNTEYRLKSFPIGTSARGTVLVGSERLKEMYPAEADKVDKGFEMLGDGEYPFRYREALSEGFAAIVPEEPLLWETTSRSGEEDYVFSDEVVNWMKIENGGLDGMQGHCVFWAKRVHLPEHLREATKDQVIQELFDQRIGMISRYPEVKRWVLVNEPIQHSPRVVNGVDRNELVLDPQEDIDTYVELFKKAREANPDAKLIVNEYNVLSGEKLDDYFDFVRELRAKGVYYVV